MPVTIHVPREHSKLEILASQEDPGRPQRVTPGGYLADLIALNKMISLCPLCVGKFNPRQVGYELWRSLFTYANCDACRARDPRCKSFIPQSLHDEVGDTRPRYRGRWASQRPRDVGRKIPS